MKIVLGEREEDVETTDDAKKGREGKGEVTLACLSFPAGFHPSWHRGASSKQPTATADHATPASSCFNAPDDKTRGADPMELAAEPHFFLPS